MSEQENSKEKTNEKLKELVIMRINAIPSTTKLSIGGSKTLSKEEMIEHIKQDDKEGKQIVQMHINFIKAVTSGKLITELNSLTN